MLNRDKLAGQLTLMAEKIFAHHEQAITLTNQQWLNIVTNPLVLNRIAALRETFNLISWDGSLGDIYNVTSCSQSYRVLAVDGSQIYPDRHIAGVQCSLINIGGCFINYGSMSTASFFSHPTVIVPEHLNNLGFTPELVDLEREAREFIAGYNFMAALNTSEKPLLGLFDGSLIFWHLENKPQEIRDYFLSQYCSALERWYNLGVPMACYLSLPKGRELAQILAYGLCNAAHADSYSCPTEYAALCKESEKLIDTHLLNAFLQPLQRTTIMHSNAPIIKEYPIHLRPCFFYLNVGKEIARIEVPTWVARDEKLLNLVIDACLDQALKGHGYPVTLAEAHEQAVIKGPDRDFFYHLIRKIGFEHQKNIVLSQKSIKKRGIGV